MRYFILLALVVLILLASLSVDGKNCKKDHCIPTATPTAQGCTTSAGYIAKACVRTAYYMGQLICQYTGSTTWFPCRIIVYNGIIYGYLPGGYYNGGYR